MQVLSALRTIVQAEVGRAIRRQAWAALYSRTAHIGADAWAARPGLLRLNASNSQIERASIASIDDSIVNLISGTGDSYNSLGVQDVDFVDTTLPMTYFIPTAGRIIILSVDTSGDTEFVQSWEDLLSPVDYTYTLALQPDIERGDSTIGIFIPNPSPVPSDLHPQPGTRGAFRDSHPRAHLCPQAGQHRRLWAALGDLSNRPTIRDRRNTRSPGMGSQSARRHIGRVERT